MSGLPTPALSCARWCVHLQDDLPDGGFLTTAMIPFALSFASFCALHQFRRARSALPRYLPLCSPFPLPCLLWALPVRPVLGGNVLLWGGGGRGARGSLCPVPSFPLRREILAQGGSLSVLVCLVLVGFGHLLLLAHVSHPVCPGRSFMLFAGMIAPAGAAVVDHALCTRRSPLYASLQLGRGGSPRPPLPYQISVGTSPRARGAPDVYSGQPWAVLGCTMLLLCGCVRSAVAGVSVVVAWHRGLRCCACCWGVAGGLGGVYFEWCQRCGW